MSDEELTEALRRVLHSRASAIRPGPADLPGAGPYRAPEPPRWRRPALVWAGAGIAAALVGAVVGLSVTAGNGRSIRTSTATSSAPPPATAAATTVPVPVTSPAPTTAAPTTVPPTTVAPVSTVPAGFSPRAVSFSSASDGWVLGQLTCASGVCASLARTTNGGRTWTSATTPAINLGSSPSSVPWPVGIRFADADNGWIYTTDQLWSTHDGGTTWQKQTLPGGTGAAMGDLEASAGHAYLAVLRPSIGVGLYSTPVTQDAWTASPLTPSMGAGPVPSPLLVLSGTTGWLITDNRTVVSGARKPNGSGWSSWTPPCSKSNGYGGMAAASPTDLVAECEEGTWGPPDPGTAAGQVWLYRSSDGGNTFSSVADVPQGPIGPLAVAPGQPQDILAISNSGILASFNGGITWSTAYSGYGGNYVGFDFVGYTTATQAVAVLDTTQGTSVLMSYDSGRSWSPVRF